MLKILKTLLLNTYQSIELLREEEEHIELMVELVHIFHLKLTSKCGQLRKLLMSEEKENQDKLLREKFQLENNDKILFKFVNFSIFYQLIRY
jgi:hypothetical protein